jgi:uncharacterized protein with PQ loop repeat
MTQTRFTRLEAIFAVLLVAGGATALIADRLGSDAAKSVGFVVVFLGAIVFGLDMIVQRRAAIGTRYTSSINPTFHVFRGIGAIAWGIVFVGAGALFIAAALSSGATPTAAGGFINRHAGLFVMLAGLVVTAWGVGSATSAVRRQGTTDRPARRTLDRLAAMLLLVPLGLAIVGWGALTTVAPAVAEQAKAWVTSAVAEKLDAFK